MKCRYCNKKISNTSQHIETKQFLEVSTHKDYELLGRGSSSICLVEGETYISGAEFLVGNSIYCNINCLMNDIHDSLKQ